MIFLNRNPTVRSFKLTIIPDTRDRTVAFGPGAVVSGSVFLTLDRPLYARSIRVIFKCQDRDARNTTTVFSVESTVLGGTGILQEIKPGGQMYLFAIKLPNVNYPPSVHSNELGHRIEYSLQAFLDLSDRTIETNAARVLYLPLVPCSLDAGPSRTQVFRRGDHVLDVTAQVVKAAHCRGDMCSVRLKSKNRSDYKISSMQVAFVVKHQRKTLTLHSETVYVAIGKQSLSNDTICHFTIPDDCLPSSRLDMFDLSYTVVVTIPWGATAFGSSSTWKFGLPYQQQQSPCIIELPITIASVPPSYQIPRHMPMPLPLFDLDYPVLPSFIPSIESPPIPAPLERNRDVLSLGDEDSFSVSPTDSIDGRTLCDGWMPPVTTDHHRNNNPGASSSYLAVPGLGTDRNRRSSTSSTWTDCSAEATSVFSDSSSRTRVVI